MTSRQRTWRRSGETLAQIYARPATAHQRAGHSAAFQASVYGSLAVMCELTGLHYSTLRAWRDAGELAVFEVRACGYRREWQPVYRLSDVLALSRQKEEVSDGPAD